MMKGSREERPMTNFAICVIPNADIETGATMAPDYQPAVIDVLPVREGAQRRCNDWNAEEADQCYYVARTAAPVTAWYFD